MKRSLRHLGWVGLAVSLFVPAGWTHAASITWDIDPTVSYIRLAIPDQTVTVPNGTGTLTVTMRIRDAGDNNNWSDAGGRRATLDGSFVTDYVNFTSVQFVAGSQGIIALQQTNLRPNPAQWDAVNATYTGTGTALAALGGRARGTYILTFDAAFLALRNVHMDIGSSVLPLGPGGSFPGSQSVFGITAADADVDGLALPLGLGQPIPDLLADPLPPTTALNTGGGTIVSTGGRNRKLTYTITMPSLTIQIDTTIINGSAEGLIVAYGQIPDSGIPFDYDGDGDVDKDDLAIFQACMTGPAVTGPPAGCTAADFAASDRDGDNDVDMRDFGKFQRCYTGANKLGTPTCAQ